MTRYDELLVIVKEEVDKLKAQGHEFEEMYDIAEVARGYVPWPTHLVLRLMADIVADDKVWVESSLIQGFQQDIVNMVAYDLFEGGDDDQELG